jgi:hypothetical protein
MIKAESERKANIAVPLLKDKGKGIKDKPEVGLAPPTITPNYKI